VLFQNGGTKAGWDSQITQHIGTITDVAAPAYVGPTALRMEQTFQGFDGYHSEVRKHDSEQPGQDLYYGEALQLPSNWIFHDQNVTFEQFAQTDVFGSPWILMFVQRDHLFVAHVVGGKGTTDLGSIAGLQGTWIRIVTRMKLGPSGAYELWVNGDKRASLTGDIQAPNKGAIRWSVGMYCTYWRREQPAGLNPMVLFHDQMRVATTYEEADPASWTDGAGPPTADAGRPEERDGGGAEDLRPAGSEGGADGSDSRTLDGGPADQGEARDRGAARAPDAVATGGSGGAEPEPGDSGGSARAPGGSCAMVPAGGRSPAPALPLALLFALALLRRPRPIGPN
jgi:MYXO-CTERM domain-containing protein